MTEHIEYCENSTITEAWAVIQGAPGKIQDSEAGALENFASKKMGNLKTEPSFVILKRKGNDNTVPAFWQKQLSWNNNRYRSRIGHRYLSVHFVKQGEGKYGKYEQSLKPQIEKWLDSYKETVSGQKESYPIEKVIFGYINLFKFHRRDFDLSQYFKVNFSTGVSSAKKGIGTLRIKFSVLNPNVTINLGVTPQSSDSETVIVTTQVEAHKIVDDGYSFENDEQIIEIIDEMKEAAKSVFFDLATTKTHTIMGVKHATSTT